MDFIKTLDCTTSVMPTTALLTMPLIQLILEQIELVLISLQVNMNDGLVVVQWTNSQSTLLSMLLLHLIPWLSKKFFKGLPRQNFFLVDGHPLTEFLKTFICKDNSAIIKKINSMDFLHRPLDWKLSKIWFHGLKNRKFFFCFWMI